MTIECDPQQKEKKNGDATLGRVCVCDDTLACVR